MAITNNPYNLSTEFIMEHLVDWFNALPANQREFASNDVPLFKVYIVTRADGEPGISVGALADGDKYEGEATYIWAGAKGTDLIATDSSFFEISKYMPGGSGAGLTIRTMEAIAKVIRVIPVNQRWLLLGGGNTASIVLQSAGEAMNAPINTVQTGNSWYGAAYNAASDRLAIFTHNDSRLGVQVLSTASDAEWPVVAEVGFNDGWNYVRTHSIMFDDTGTFLATVIMVYDQWLSIVIHVNTQEYLTIPTQNSDFHSHDLPVCKISHDGSMILHVDTGLDAFNANQLTVFDTISGEKLISFAASTIGNAVFSKDDSAVYYIESNYMGSDYPRSDADLVIRRCDISNPSIDTHVTIATLPGKDGAGNIKLDTFITSGKEYIMLHGDIETYGDFSATKIDIDTGETWMITNAQNESGWNNYAMAVMDGDISIIDQWRPDGNDPERILEVDLVNWTVGDVIYQLDTTDKYFNVLLGFK